MCACVRVRVFVCVRAYVHATGATLFAPCRVLTIDGPIGHRLQGASQPTVCQLVSVARTV